MSRHTIRNSAVLAIVLASIGLWSNEARAQQLRFQNRSDIAGMHSEGPGQGIAVHDFDGDGDDDVFVAVSLFQPSRLFSNRGDGTFDDVTSAAGIGLSGKYYAPVFADFDNDGHADLYVAGRDSPNTLYRNNGDGTFTDVTTGSGLDPHTDVGALAVADVDGDGFVDLFEAVDRAPDRLYRNVGGSWFFEDITDRAGVGGHPFSVAMQASWHDVDRDGDPDLFAVHDGSDPVVSGNRLHLNTGAFPMPDRAASMGLGDIGRGNAMGIAWGDYDGDGWEDVYVSRLDYAGLYRALGNGAFEPVPDAAGAETNGMAWGTVFGDFDNDGDSDLFVANSYGYRLVPNQLYENRGGQFVDVAPDAGVDLSIQAIGAASGDFDRDGNLDLVVPAYDGTVRLFRGDPTASGNWLRVRLSGNRVNRMAIGARVEVQVGGRTLVRSLSAGDSYCSQSSSTLHFGLGDATIVDRIRVHWGSGDSDDRVNVSANSDVLIVQTATSSTAVAELELPAEPLLEAYPLPFSDRMTIRVRTASSGELRIDVVDVLGRTVALVPGRHVGPGWHEFHATSAMWPAGFYAVRARGPGGTQWLPVVRR